MIRNHNQLLPASLSLIHLQWFKIVSKITNCLEVIVCKNNATHNRSGTDSTAQLPIVRQNNPLVFACARHSGVKGRQRGVGEERGACLVSECRSRSDVSVVGCCDVRVAPVDADGVTCAPQNVLRGSAHAHCRVARHIDSSMHNRECVNQRSQSTPTYAHSTCSPTS